MIFGPFRALFVLGIVGALVGVFFGVKGAVTAKHAVDSVNRKGGDGDSLFHAARLDGSLNKIRAKVGADGQLLQLNIYPGYIAVDASTGSEDKARSFRIQEDGKVDELPVSLTGPGKLADNVFPLAKVDPKAIEKVANATAAKEHLTLDDVTHVIVLIQPDSGKPGISAYTTNSRFWRAELDGSGLSNPTQQARKALDGVEKTLSGTDAVTPAPAAKAPATGAPASAVDLQTCIQSAGTNATKIAACTG
jgi:hypothetical protein